MHISHIAFNHAGKIRNTIYKTPYHQTNMTPTQLASPRKRCSNHLTLSRPAANEITITQPTLIDLSCSLFCFRALGADDAQRGHASRGLVLCLFWCGWVAGKRRKKETPLMQPYRWCVPGEPAV